MLWFVTKPQLSSQLGQVNDYEILSWYSFSNLVSREGFLTVVSWKMERGSKKDCWTQSRGTKLISFVKRDETWMEHDRCVLHALYIQLHLVNYGNVQIM